MIPGCLKTPFMRVLVDEAANGLNGLAAADREECNCKEENRFLRSRRARLKFSFSTLLHPAKISEASARANTSHFPFWLGLPAKWRYRRWPEQLELLVLE